MLGYNCQSTAVSGYNSQKRYKLATKLPQNMNTRSHLRSTDLIGVISIDLERQ